MRTTLRWAVALGLCLFLSRSMPARAGLIGTDYITISATAGAESGSWNLAIPAAWTFPASGVWTWQLAAPDTIWNTGHTQSLGTIQSLTLEYDGDPSVLLGFNVQAGALATNFTVNSSVVSFGAISNPSAVASSSMTVTDTDGNGASITGLEAGAESYKATYNGSVDWALLNNSFSAGAFSSTSSVDNRQPAVGLQTIVANVSSIQSLYHFTLSANDLASGTSNFTVVPEPSMIGLGMMIAAAMGLRRRH